MIKPRKESDLPLLIQLIDQAYVRKTWHGPNLRGSIRGLSARDAAWRPRSGRHNIWEIVVHCAYWKYSVWRRLKGEKRGSFPLRGNNWLKRPTGKLTEKAWRDDIALLATMHRMLRTAVEEVRPTTLSSRTTSQVYTIRELIHGIASHDVYHAGQIQLIKRLHRSR
jgi:uncharacterized damage-inducible protein DinB